MSEDIREFEAWIATLEFMAEEKWKQVVEADRAVALAKTEWVNLISQYDQLMGQRNITIHRLEELRANAPQPVVDREVYMIEDGLVIATATRGLEGVTLRVDADDRE